jgi:hypothetical protein
MPCPLCANPAPTRPTLAHTLQAMRRAGWAELPAGLCCASCVDEARMVRAADDSTRAAFVAARAASPG